MLTIARSFLGHQPPEIKGVIILEANIMSEKKVFISPARIIFLVVVLAILSLVCGVMGYEVGYFSKSIGEFYWFLILAFLSFGLIALSIVHRDRG